MFTDKVTREELLKLAKKRIYLEGNILKVLKAEEGDTEFKKYLTEANNRDKTSRRKRLEVTKQVQSQNKELVSKQEETDALMVELQEALELAKNSEWEAEKLKEEAEKGKEQALEDLELMQKKTQFELIGLIVKTALWIIGGVGVLTSCLYLYVLSSGIDAKIIESTWSNLFGILLTNSFSIIGTIMGVKYATEKQ